MLGEWVGSPPKLGCCSEGRCWFPVWTSQSFILRPLSFYFVPKLGVFSSVRAACALGQAITFSFPANQLALAAS